MKKMKEENASLRKLLREAYLDDVKKGECDDEDGEDQDPPRQRKRSKHLRKQQEKPAATQPPTSFSSGSTQEDPKSHVGKELRIRDDVRNA